MGFALNTAKAALKAHNARRDGFFPRPAGENPSRKRRDGDAYSLDLAWEAAASALVMSNRRRRSLGSEMR